MFVFLQGNVKGDGCRVLSLCGNLMQRTDNTIHFESTDLWGKAVQSLRQREQNVQQIYERGSTATEEHLEEDTGKDCHTSNNTQQCTDHHSTDAGSWGPQLLLISLYKTRTCATGNCTAPSSLPGLLWRVPKRP